MEKSNAIKKAVASDTEPLKRLEAAEALLLTDSPEGWAAVKAAIEGGSTTVKYRALFILSTHRRREAIDLLVPLLEDPTEYVRDLARTALIGTLTALYPYQKFDHQAPADKLKAWWEKNRGK
jgi:HEAT repeat protein